MYLLISPSQIASTLKASQDTFGEKYSQVCKEMNLEETDCVMFGIGGDEYNSLNRGSDKNRVCISDLLI